MTQEDRQPTKRRCPACDADAAEPAGDKNSFSMLRCRRCATLYSDALPASSSTEDYESYYDEHNLTVPAFIHRQLKGILARFEPFRQTNRLLDVGCGAGMVLEAARDARWEPWGIEVSRPAVEHARGLGFEVFHGELKDAGYPAAHFDVVTASEILEHVADPKDLIREIARVLRPGGLFWATTPHGRGASARLLGTKWSVVCPPEHLHLFSRGGMKRLLAEAGFSRPRILTHGVNPFEILNAVRQRGAGATANGGAEAGGEAGGGGGRERVESSYQLNEKLTKNQFNKALKTTLNGLLGMTRMGDSLKIWAVK